MKKNILITGMPRSGKSTLLEKSIDQFPNRVGFITNEVRKAGERVGFEMETNNGEKSLLASIDFNTNFQVSKYFVDIKNLESIVQQVSEFHPSDLLYLDEIGQMELLSEKFKNLVKQYLCAPNICVATLSKIYSDEFTDQIKKRDDIILIELSEDNRESVKKYLAALIRKVIKAKRYLSEPERFKVSPNAVVVSSDHGDRVLRKQSGGWVCECQFFQENRICSHIIALEELLKTR